MISTSTEKFGSDYEMQTTHWGQELAHETGEKLREKLLTRKEGQKEEEGQEGQEGQEEGQEGQQAKLPTPAKRRLASI